MKHNNAIPHQHFHKHWQRRVKTWFNQPARSLRRGRTRAAKAAALFPRPLESLRPVVRCCTIRYNAKTRLGRGFTPAEIKAAGLKIREARSFGIAVDNRRRNKSFESLTRNSKRLKEYQSKLLKFPQRPNSKKHAKVFATPEELKAAKQVTTDVMWPVERTHHFPAPRVIRPKERRRSVVMETIYQRKRQALKALRVKREKAAAAAAEKKDQE